MVAKSHKNDRYIYGEMYGEPFSRSKLEKMMVKRHIVSQLDSKSDWILDAEESVDYGFADGVLGSENFRI